MNIQKNRSLPYLRSLFAGAALAGCFLVGMSSIYAQPAGTREWTGNGNPSNIFNPSGGSNQGTGPTKNWTNVGEGEDAGGINSKALIVGIQADDLVLSSAGSAPYSLHILSSAGSFTLNGDDGPSSSRTLTFTDGVTVDAGVTATFGVGIQATAAASSTIRFDIGAGSILHANRGIGVNSVNGQLVKTGTGTLVIRNARTYQTGVVFRLEEGTTEFDTGVPFAGTSNPLTLRLGTESTTATLAGRVNLSGTLITESTERSILDPNGVLNITNINLSEGATVHFELGSTDLITGDGELTLGLGDLDFVFTGGEVGQTYSIFEFDSVTGFDPSRFLISSAGYEGSIWSLENGVVSVQVIPEPLYGALLLLAPLAFFVSKKRRQNPLIRTEA